MCCWPGVSGFGPRLAAASSPSQAASIRIQWPAFAMPQQASEMGPFINYGNGLGDRSSYKFLWGGVRSGQDPVAGGPCRHFERPVRAQWEHHAALAGIYAGSAMQTFTYPGADLCAPVGGGTYHGVSITPVIFRWNFLTQLETISAMVSGRGRADLYHPQVSARLCSCRMGRRAATSVWNFSPQGGVGIHYFMRPQAIDRPGRECGSHFIGIAGRSESRE